MTSALASLLPILACPVCHSRIELHGERVRCLACDKTYSVEGGIPRLFHPDSIFAPELTVPALAAEARPGWARRWLSSSMPGMTTWIDETIFDFLNQSSKDARILNLGSGDGLFDDRIDPAVAMINLDVRATPLTHLLAERYIRLPFQDDSLDAVFSNAVLEHVARPWIVAQEIRAFLSRGDGC